MWKKSLFFLIDKNSIFLQTPSSPLHNELCRLKVHQTAGRLGKHWLHFYAELPFHPSWNGFWCYSDMKKRQDLIESGRLPRSLSEIQTLSCHFTISSYQYPAPSQHRNSCLWKSGSLTRNTKTKGPDSLLTCFSKPIAESSSWKEWWRHTTHSSNRSVMMCWQS